MKKQITRFLIINERDVGLFSLIHQVINSLLLAEKLNLIPICIFGDNCCYYTPFGYHDKKTVWEYYFHPLDYHYPEAYILGMSDLERSLFLQKSHTSKQYSPCIDGEKADFSIPYLADPKPKLRHAACEIIHKHIHVRDYIAEKVEQFWTQHLSSYYVIGVHIRGTDAIEHDLREQTVVIQEYIDAIQQALSQARKISDQEVKVFVASDDEEYILAIKDVYPDRCECYPSIRKNATETINAGVGPTGEIMPYFLTQNRDVAAKNGEDVLIEFLLLSKCNYFIHNISSLARSVLLQNPELDHLNVRKDDYQKIKDLLSKK